MKHSQLEKPSTSTSIDPSFSFSLLYTDNFFFTGQEEEEAFYLHTCVVKLTSYALIDRGRPSSCVCVARVTLSYPLRSTGPNNNNNKNGRKKRKRSVDRFESWQGVKKMNAFAEGLTQRNVTLSPSPIRDKGEGGVGEWRRTSLTGVIIRKDRWLFIGWPPHPTPLTHFLFFLVLHHRPHPLDQSL